jgi:hypothetical protein
MSRRTVEPANGAEREEWEDTEAPNGNILPDPIPEGEIFTDITKNQWQLSRSIGAGGFGQVYLASSGKW